MGFVEAKLSFDPKPREYSVIAVNETVVECAGQPLYVWVAVDAYTRQPIWLGVSPTHTSEPRRTRSGFSVD